jgi:SAM-dependent methyltransferase
MKCPKFRHLSAPIAALLCLLIGFNAWSSAGNCLSLIQNPEDMVFANSDSMMAAYLKFAEYYTAARKGATFLLANRGQTKQKEFPDGLPYAITNRDLDEVSGEHFADYATGFLTPKFLNGKRVLDAGCGGCYAVHEMRMAGADAYGIDLKIYKGLSAPYLLEKSILETGFPDNSFDMVVSTMSVFHYNPVMRGNQLNSFFLNALKELTRITKPGGPILISPVKVSRSLLLKLLEQIPELQVIRAIEKYRDELSDLELTSGLILQKKAGPALEPGLPNN